jgi:hypothetical protein
MLHSTRLAPMIPLAQPIIDRLERGGFFDDPRRREAAARLVGHARPHSTAKRAVGRARRPFPFDARAIAGRWA